MERSREQELCEGTRTCELAETAITYYKNGLYQDAKIPLRDFISSNWHTTVQTPHFEEASTLTIKRLKATSFCFTEFLLSEGLQHVKPIDSGTSFSLLNELTLIALDLCEFGVGRHILNYLEENSEEKSFIGEAELVAVKCNLGCLYGSLGHYEKALENYHMAEALEKSRISLATSFTKDNGTQPFQNYLPVIYNNVGRIYDNLGQYEKAERYLKDSLLQKLNPMNKANILITKLNLVNVLKSQGKRNDAMMELQESKELCNGDVPSSIQGLFELGLLSLSSPVCKETLQLEKSCNERASILTKRGSKMDESTSVFLENYAEFCLQKGNISQAKEALESMDLHFHDTPRFFSLLLKMGHVYFIKQDYKRCCEFFEKAEKVAAETFGASNVKLLPIYSRLAELWFHQFKNNFLSKQYIEKLMKVVSVLRENGGRLLPIHLEHLMNTGILDSCTSVTVENSCIVVQLSREKLFEEKTFCATKDQEEFSTPKNGFSFFHSIHDDVHFQQSKLHLIELPFYIYNNYSMAKHLVTLATALVESEKEAIAITALESELKRQRQLSGNKFQCFLISSSRCFVETLLRWKGKGNKDFEETINDATVVYRNIQRHMKPPEIHDKLSDEESSTCLAALMMLCHSFSTLQSEIKSKEVLEIYQNLSQLLQELRKGPEKDYYLIDNQGKMVYFSSTEILVGGRNVTCNFLVTELYHDVGKPALRDDAKEKFSVFPIEDGSLRTINAIASNVMAVDVKDIRILMKNLFKSVKYTLEITKPTPVSSFIVFINDKISPESIPTLSNDLDVLPLLIHAVENSPASALKEHKANLVKAKKDQQVTCKNFVRYQTDEKTMPDSFLHKILLSCFKEKEPLGEIHDFTEKEKSVSLLILHPKMIQIRVICQNSCIDVEINSFPFKRLECECILYAKYFRSLMEKCANSLGFHLRHTFSKTSCQHNGNHKNPVHKSVVCADLHGTTIVMNQQLQATKIDRMDFPCVKIHDTSSISKEPDAHRIENVSCEGKAEVQRYETEDSEYDHAVAVPDTSFLHERTKQIYLPRKSVFTQTEMLEIPPYNEKRNVKNLLLESNTQKRESELKLEFGQGLSSAEKYRSFQSRKITNNIGNSLNRVKTNKEMFLNERASSLTAFPAVAAHSVETFNPFTLTDEENPTSLVNVESENYALKFLPGETLFERDKIVRLRRKQDFQVEQLKKGRRHSLATETEVTESSADGRQKSKEATASLGNQKEKAEDRSMADNKQHKLRATNLRQPTSGCSSDDDHDRAQSPSTDDRVSMKITEEQRSEITSEDSLRTDNEEMLSHVQNADSSFQNKETSYKRREKTLKSSTKEEDLSADTTQVLQGESKNTVVKYDEEDSLAARSNTNTNVPLRNGRRNNSENESKTHVKKEEDQQLSKGDYLKQGARPKSGIVSVTNPREPEEKHKDGSLESNGLETAFLARHTEDASIHYFTNSDNVARPLLFQETNADKASFASCNDLDENMSLTVPSPTQQSTRTDKDYLSIFDLRSQRTHVGAIYSMPPVPAIKSMSSSVTKNILPSSTVLISSSSEKLATNLQEQDFGTRQGTDVAANEQQNSDNQGCQILPAQSLPSEEKQTRPEDLPTAGEIEMAQLTNFNSSSAKSPASEKERLNKLKEHVAETCTKIRGLTHERQTKSRQAEERKKKEKEEEERGLLEEQPNEQKENEELAEDQNGRRIGEVGRLEEANASSDYEFPADDETKYPVQESPAWLCEHYQRRCKVKFPCCNNYYSCHRCHNNSDGCTNESAKASDATHLQCIICGAEQPVTESYDTQTCQACGTKLSEYFCPKCKHFTGVEKRPYHCDKCGICRIHKDRSFHCDVCNVCLDKRLDGNHKCRPDSGHDECCICLEDAFSGCQILPCSHKVHRDCAIAMIQNGIRTCPVCRHPLYKSDDE